MRKKMILLMLCFNLGMALYAEAVCDAYPQAYNATREQWDTATLSSVTTMIELKTKLGGDNELNALANTTRALIEVLNSRFYNDDCSILSKDARTLWGYINIEARIQAEKGGQ